MRETLEEHVTNYWTEILEWQNEAAESPLETWSYRLPTPHLQRSTLEIHQVSNLDDLCCSIFSAILLRTARLE